MFDGTTIENTGGNRGHINPYDAGTKETISKIEKKKEREAAYNAYIAQDTQTPQTMNMVA